MKNQCEKGKWINFFRILTRNGIFNIRPFLQSDQIKYTPTKPHSHTYHKFVLIIWRIAKYVYIFLIQSIK